MEIAHQVLYGEGKGSGPEALRNLQSELSCQHSQPSQTAPKSMTTTLLPDRWLTEDGAEPPPSDWGPLQSLVLTKMKDFHESKDHRLLPLCYLQKKVFARAQGLDSRHPTNILGISTTPTSIMTTPNKLFFSEACGLFLANPSPWCPSSWPTDQSRLGQEQHLVSSSRMMALNWLKWI